MLHRLRSMLLAFAACLLASPAGAATRNAGCPESSVSLGGAIFTTTSAAAFDTASVIGEIRWDLAAGQVFMHSNGWLGGPVADVFDDFDVIGVPPGTPVDVIAELTVDGAVWTDGCGGSGCGGMYQVDFTHEADSRQVLHSDHLFTGRTDHHDVVQIPLVIVAGQPERLEIRALGHRTPGGSHYSEATCTLRMTPAIEGAVINSCQGYVSAPVPALPRTWGRIKTLYR